MPLYLLCLTCSHQWRRWRPFKNKTRAMEGGSAVTFKITIFLWSPGNMWGPYWVLSLIYVFDGIFEFLMECLLKWFFFFLYGISCSAKSTWLVRKMLLVMMFLYVCGDTIEWVYLVWWLPQTSLSPQFISCLSYSWSYWRDMQIDLIPSIELQQTEWSWLKNL